MKSRWWFWRGPIQSDEHARAVLNFAAAAFGLLAVPDIFNLITKFNATSAINASTFIGLALLLRLMKSRAVAVCIFAFSAFFGAIFAATFRTWAGAGTVTALWGALYLSLFGFCMVAALRAFVAAAFLHRRAHG
jgi:hypothetical protein